MSYRRRREGKRRKLYKRDERMRECILEERELEKQENRR